MNYKEIIWKLRYCILDADDVEQAAFAIETLLAEREAAAEVVCCKDCRHCKEHNDRMFCNIHAEYTTMEYFCASGARREEV